MNHGVRRSEIDFKRYSPKAGRGRIDRAEPIDYDVSQRSYRYCKSDSAKTRRFQSVDGRINNSTVQIPHPTKKINVK